MKIERIELFHVAMPLIYPWRTAYGEDAAIHSVLCHMTSGSVEGWGESTPLAAPCYSPEWAGGVFHTVSEWLAPAVIGQEIDSGEDLQKKLSLYKGNPFAKAALDNAWWSLHSRKKDVLLHVALGATRNEVPVGADFGVMDHLDDLIEEVGTAVEQNFPRIKLKFRPGWDIPMLKAVRSSFPEATFHIDCNSGYRIQDTALFQAIDEFELAMIEQPLQHDDLTDHAQLQKIIKTPVCLDESITHPGRAQQAVTLKSCRYINIKPGRVGGLTNAVKIHDLCQEAEIPCWVGGMLESATGASHCTALAMLDNFTYPADIFPSEKYYHEELAEFPLRLSNNDLGVPSVKAFEELPDPDLSRLESLTIQRKVIKS
ncbi:o-succinylbenzoate synthase [Gimesia aquarii]|uniref:o-succinylbenzoate synthase n=1 Tax=Gimesia aquarii TaxID=2527964 RepID=A0A517WVN8_9PLAN|nr:o-succinylbenzoate synthase [Gimesia aquarii]QDU09320.1 o-succinylbenzoate synthase [Gimesia aquarii]